MKFPTLKSLQLQNIHPFNIIGAQITFNKPVIISQLFM